MDKNEKKLNNKGFTLIELIVTSLVSVMVIMAVTLFMGASLSQFGITGTRTSLQNEAQIAENQIGALLMESVRITEKSSGDKEGYLLETGRNEELLLVYDRKEQRLLVGKAYKEESGNPVEVLAEEIAGAPKKNLLASNITRFELSPKTVSGEKGDALVAVTMEVAIGGKSMKVKNNYYLRNGEW